ncbi:flippase [Kordiimonas aestuarii]|uniref:flippase n=1 Tax=Kordiimonas aestuarii TaxID=1005925 RepID=UPI0021D356E7|nr:flippase [Kordiimonas aestuarii]
MQLPINLLKSKPSLALGGNIIQKALALVTNIVLARLLGAEGYGAVALGLSFFIMVQSFASLGLTEGLVRFGASALATGDRHQFHKIFISSTSLTLIVTIPICIALATFSEPISHYFEAGDEFTRLLGLTMMAVPFYSFILMVSTFAQAQQKILQQQLVLVGRALLILLLCIPVFGPSPSAADFGWILLAGHVALSILCLAPLLRVPHLLVGFLPKQELKRLIGFSLAIFMTHINWVIWSNVDRFMLAKLGSLADVGLYNVVALLGLNMQIGVVAMGSLIMPVCASTFARGDHVSTADYYRWYSLLGLIVAGLIGACLLMEGEAILGLFGPDFINAGPALILLVIAQFIAALPGPVGRLLLVIGKERFTVYASFGQTIMNVALNWLLIPVYGVEGAAMATLASLAAMRIFYSVYIWRKLNFLIPDIYALAAGLMIIASAFVANYIGDTIPYDILGINIIDYVIFAGLCMPGLIWLVLHRHKKRVTLQAL